ncbi:MAG: hypothetical protein QF570_08870 [Myxococcota bacterium]|jgi:hypothetical protein|nr:hypothetical protein [Myxococcota bacterium]
MRLLSWIVEQRLILCLYIAGAALAYSELRLPTDEVSGLDAPGAYFDEGTGVAEVSAKIYPDRALTLYYQAFQKSFCTGPARTRPEGCEAIGPVEPGEVRELIERAIAKGNRSIEELMYNYAVILVEEGAPQEEIDTAVRNWRLSHPTMDRPDPRTLGRTRQQGKPS